MIQSKMIQSKRNAVCKEVIIYKELIGEGREADPYRELTVVREKDGTFIAEYDPYPDKGEACEIFSWSYQETTKEQKERQK